LFPSLLLRAIPFHPNRYDHTQAGTPAPTDGDAADETDEDEADTDKEEEAEEDEDEDEDEEEEEEGAGAMSGRRVSSWGGKLSLRSFAS
jgi:hypothetical protein